VKPAWETCGRWILSVPPLEQIFSREPHANTNMMKVAKDKSEDYALGYRHGSDSDMPNTTNVWNREAYFDGYVAGSHARDVWMAGEKVPSG
jgi:hypothetical protein